MREVFAIWVAVRTWGAEWGNQQILIFTDSEVITQVWKSRTCRNKDIMRVVRAIFLFAAKHNTNILMQHIPGVMNIAADLLSRLQVRKFKQLDRCTNEAPTPTPPDTWAI